MIEHDFHLELLGRAAHAGVEPEKGRSAILEAAHQVLALHALNGRWPTVTVNAGVIQGGTRPNVVAERCEMHVDLRAATVEAFEAASAEVERLEKLGATIDKRMERWVVLRAPTGQRFCVVRAQRAGFPKNATTWS